MRCQALGDTLAASFCGACLGVFAGVGVVALGSVIGGSQIGFASTVALCGAVGFWVDGFRGLLLGLLLGVLAASFGQAVSATPEGRWLTVFGCAGLGGWCAVRIARPAEPHGGPYRACRRGVAEQRQQARRQPGEAPPPAARRGPAAEKECATWT